MPKNTMRGADDKTRLSYWFPIIQAAGFRVPKTVIVKATENEINGLWQRLDGDYSTKIDSLFDRLYAASYEVGHSAVNSQPIFLRTDFTSGKHDWKRTCFVEEVCELPKHVFALAEFSACADFLGFPFDTWVVREFLKTSPAFHAFSGEMPITREFRFFVRDGEIEHWQPYWPPDAIADYAPADVPDWRGRLAKLNDPTGDYAELFSLSHQVARVVPGYWSVDWLLTTDRGWVLTDMAEGENSFRWDVENGGGLPNTPNKAGDSIAVVPEPPSTDHFVDTNKMVTDTSSPSDGNQSATQSSDPSRGSAAP